MNDLALWISLALVVVAAVPTIWAIRTRQENRLLRRQADELNQRLKDLGEQLDYENHRIESLEESLAGAQGERDALAEKVRQIVTSYQVMQQQWQAARDQVTDLTQKRRRWEGAARSGARRVIAAEKERDQTREELARIENRNDELSRRIRDLERQLDSLALSDGVLWQRPVVESSPPFRPLSERHFPIISVLNLKGGVGKTTITAHLAGMLGQQGKKVLAIDLDFQRSLSQILLTPEQRRNLHTQRRCLQHFLGGEEHGFRQVLACAHSIEAGMNNCWIIPNSDPGEGEESLETVEAQLLTEWATQRGTKDVRLLLREGLHDPEAGRSFDYVLFDCPPRLTAGCINALAASDFILIPVILDAMTARAVPHLLNALKRLRSDLLPQLSVLGVVANLVTMRMGEPTIPEKEIREDLNRTLGAVWENRVPIFKSTIPNHVKFAEAANSLRHGKLKLALRDETIREHFAELVKEIEEEIEKHERRNTATVPS